MFILSLLFLIYGRCEACTRQFSAVLHLPIWPLSMVLSYHYSDCSATLTASQSALIDGTEFYAELETFTQYIPSQEFIVTYHYPAVTLTSLRPFDILAGTVTGTASDSPSPIDSGSLSFTVIIPAQAIVATTSSSSPLTTVTSSLITAQATPPTTTTTFISTNSQLAGSVGVTAKTSIATATSPSSDKLSGGAIGGIVGGIIGGFLLLGALLFCYIRRTIKSRTEGTASVVVPENPLEPLEDPKIATPLRYLEETAGGRLDPSL